MTSRLHVKTTTEYRHHIWMIFSNKRKLSINTRKLNLFAITFYKFIIEYFYGSRLAPSLCLKYRSGLTVVDVFLNGPTADISVSERIFEVFCLDPIHFNSRLPWSRTNVMVGVKLVDYDGWFGVESVDLFDIQCHRHTGTWLCFCGDLSGDRSIRDHPTLTASSIRLRPRRVAHRMVALRPHLVQQSPTW